jgi:hypothetical protein
MEQDGGLQFAHRPIRGGTRDARRATMGAMVAFELCLLRRATSLLEQVQIIHDWGREHIHDPISGNVEARLKCETFFETA